MVSKEPKGGRASCFSPQLLDCLYCNFCHFHSWLTYRCTDGNSSERTLNRQLGSFSTDKTGVRLRKCLTVQINSLTQLGNESKTWTPVIGNRWSVIEKIGWMWARRVPLLLYLNFKLCGRICYSLVVTFVSEFRFPLVASLLYLILFIKIYIRTVFYIFLPACIGCVCTNSVRFKFWKESTEF